MNTEFRISSIACALLVILLQLQLCPAQQVRLDSLQKALSTQKKQDTTRANTLIELTYEYLNSGSTKARTTALEAHHIAFSNLSRALQARACIALGNAESKRRNWAEARKLLEEGLKLYEKLGDIEGIGTSFLEIAKLHAETGNNDSAIEFAERADSLSRKHSYPSINRKAAEVLSEIWLLRRNYEKAYLFYREYTSLKDSMLSAENRRYIAELEELHLAEQRENQIRLLQKEKELNDLDLARSQDALRLRTLEWIHTRQAAKLDDEIQRHENNKLQKELDQRNTINTKKEELLAMTQRDQELNQELLKNKNRLNYALITGLFLTFLLALAIVNRIKQKQKLSELRAREAEFHAQSATMQAMGISLEAERKEHALQQQFARRLLTSQEEERSRIARELHDSLSQGLIVMKNRAMMCLRSIDNPEKLHIQLQAISDAAGDSLREVRQISRDLHPHQLDNLGITEALRGMIQLISESTEISFKLDLDNLDGLYDHEGEIALYRIVQEAMNNIHKHSAARNVELKAKRMEASVAMVIRDDGVGFDVASLSKSGFGIQSMAERIRILGGTMKINSTPAKGTVINLSLPYNVDISQPLIPGALHIMQENRITAS